MIKRSKNCLLKKYEIITAPHQNKTKISEQPVKAIFVWRHFCSIPSGEKCVLLLGATISNESWNVSDVAVCFVIICVVVTQNITFNISNQMCGVNLKNTFMAHHIHQISRDSQFDAYFSNVKYDFSAY